MYQYKPRKCYTQKQQVRSQTVYIHDQTSQNVQSDLWYKQSAK